MYKRLYRWIMVLAGSLLVHAGIAQSSLRPVVTLPNGFEVNTYTGNLYYSRTDLRIPAPGLPIDISFSYNATRRNKDWGMGKGWTFTYNMSYTREADGIWIERNDGKREWYKKNGNRFESPKGVYDLLEEYEAGKLRLVTQQRETWWFENATHRRATRVSVSNGNAIRLSYTDSLITGIDDDAGHRLTLTWTDKHLTRISDNSCSPERKVEYTYDAGGNPVKVTDPMNNYVQFHYDTTSRITGYSDEENNNMLIAWNPRGSVQRITSCSTTHSFSYQTTILTTVVTEKVNNQHLITSYKYDTLGRIVHKEGNCCGFNVDYNYDEQNNVLARKSGSLRSSHYEYDASGNVTRETDAAGNVKSYSYDPVHHKVASETDYNGNTTTYLYDAAGNLTQLNKPLGVTEKYTYDNKGNRLTFTDGNKNATRFEYDNGNLVKVTDPEGGITRYTYDCRGNRLSETDPNQHTISYEYNLIDRKVKSTDALGHVTTYTYNRKGQQLTQTNPLNKVLTYEYDGLGRRIKNILPDGSSTRLAYDEQGNIIQQTDANGNNTTNTYNSRRQLLTTTDAAGNTRYYEYDANGRKLSETDAKGQITKFAHDESGNIIRLTDAMGSTISSGYDPFGNKISETDANGNITIYRYDLLNRLTAVIDPFNKSVSYTYDANGNKLTETNKKGKVTRFTYDKLDRLLTVTDAAGNIIENTFDAKGNLLREKDALGNITTYTYDAMDHNLSVTNAMQEKTTYTYDAAGRQTTASLPNGQSLTRHYDDNNRVTSMTDDQGTLVTYTYDNNNNLLTEKDANGGIQSAVYDALNRIVERKDAMGNSTRYRYDANDNLVEETDRNGNSKRFTYDALDRKTAAIDALGNTTRFTYDANGNCVRITDATNNTTGYVYDQLNRTVTENYADGNTTSYEYDANGNRVKRIDNNGAATSYEFNDLDQLVNRRYADGAADAFTYNAAGKRLTANNANAKLTFTYDKASRLLTLDQDGKTTSYAYSVSARTRTITYPGGKVLREERGKRNELLKVLDGGTALGSYTYDAGGRLTEKAFGNGQKVVYTYNNNNWLTSLKVQSSNALSFTYTYDREGNRQTVEKQHRPAYSEKFVYDELYRVTGFYNGRVTGNTLSDTTFRSRYEYDPLHNRRFAEENGKLTAYSNNNLNAYTKVTVNGSSSGYQYDRNGNLLHDELHAYAYDGEDRMITVDNGQTAIHKYDALGRRVRTTTAAGTTVYYYDEKRVIEEYEGSALKKSYVYGVWLDDVLAYTSGGAVHYLVNNLQGTVLAAYKNNDLAERYEYNALGTVNIFSAGYAPLSASAIGNSIAFTGRPYLDYQHMYDFRWRHYSGASGRFAQRDRMGYVDGMNLYHGYFAPNFTDPNGTEKSEACFGFKITPNNFQTLSYIIRMLRGRLPFLKSFNTYGAGVGINVCMKDECCNDSQKKLMNVSLDADFGMAIEASSSRFFGFEAGISGSIGLSVNGKIEGEETCTGMKGNLCLVFTLEGTLAVGIEYDYTSNPYVEEKFGIKGGVKITGGFKLCLTTKGPYYSEFSLEKFKAKAFLDINLIRFITTHVEWDL